MSILYRLRKRLILAIILGALVFLAISVYSDFEKVAASLASFNLIFILAVLPLVFANYILRFAKWHYFLQLLGINLTKKASFKVFLSGLTMTISPGRFGEVVKSLLIKMINGTAIAKSAPIVVAERFTDFIAFLILSAYGAVAFATGGKVLLASTGVTILVILAVGSRRFANLVLGLVGRLPLIKRFAHKAAEAYESMYQLITLRRLVPAVVISVLSWFCECIAFWVVLVGLDIAKYATFSDAVFIYAFSTIAGAITMMPGGIGLTEVSLTGLLLSLTSCPSRSAAAAATIIIRLCTLWFAVIVGIVASTRLKELGWEASAGSP